MLFVFGDQWRAQATGYAGDPNARTPHLDRIHDESISFTTAVSTCPVCTPARASLLTGQYPLTHGLFMNDVPLDPEAVSIGKVFGAAGYDTGYIGKWHVDGHGWNAYIPPERRQGFRFWRGYELSHDYNHSHYWADDAERHTWEGYDAEAQTCCAQEFIRDRAAAARAGTPFFLMLSWGPPHGSYHTAPPRFREHYDPSRMDNLCGRPEYAELQAEMEAKLSRLLARLGDDFLPGDAYLRRWGYEVDPQTGYSVTIMEDLAHLRAMVQADRREAR
ncbi:MAG: sulfatase-like hydrolase/transferase [Chloroflexi bacterium]|nr:sulfatase-like hydrolase/transferase [Chloroflexota bacterium]